MDEKVQIISIATNDYLALWQAQVRECAQAIHELGWEWLLLTDNVAEAKKFAKKVGLEQTIRVRPTLPFKFPLASIIRYLAIIQNCEGPGWICYLDADMKIENPLKLDSAIRNSSKATVVSHPGYTRPAGYVRELGIKHYISNVLLHVRFGGLGAWESRKVSTAYVPRSRRKRYVQAAIFFGPASEILTLSATCWAWTESDLRDGIIPRWHDESYLNRWIVEHDCSLVGPEFCYFDFPWLHVDDPVVRAVDKAQKSVTHQ